jgi:hypothetical protein
MVSAKVVFPHPEWPNRTTLRMFLVSYPIIRQKFKLKNAPFSKGEELVISKKKTFFLLFKKDEKVGNYFGIHLLLGKENCEV